MNEKKATALFYFYAISGISLWFIVYFTWQAVWAIDEIRRPEEEIIDENVSLANFEAYKAYFYRKVGDDSLKKDSRISNEELRKMFEGERRAEESKIRKYGKERIQNFLFALMVGLPIFIFHWRKAESIRKEPES